MSNNYMNIQCLYYWCLTLQNHSIDNSHERKQLYSGSILYNMYIICRNNLIEPTD